MINAVTAILYILKDLSAVLSLLLIMRFVFSEKLSIRPVKVIAFTSLVIINAFTGFFLLKNNIDDYDSVLDFISNLIYIFALICLTEKVGKGKIILTVFVYIYTADLIWALVSSYSGAGLIIEYSVNTAIFSAACVLLYISGVKSKINILPGVFAGIPSWIYIVLLFFELTCYYKEFGASQSWYKAMYIISVSGIIICLFYLIFRIASVTHRQNEIITGLQAQNEVLEKKHSGDVELRRFRHDYKNHMIVLGSLLSAGKTDEASDYVKKLGDISGEFQDKIKTGNSAADALINHKCADAAKKDICIEFTGFIPSGCIDDMDICTVLSNLLDNAIEATNKCLTERNIRLEANLVREHFLLTISNPYVFISKDTKGNLKTTKTDRINHGIGMKNVERIVEKYHGAIYTEQEYSVFTSNIRMKIRTNLSD